MATTTPNFGWDIPQSSDLVKDGATAIAALGTDIDTSLVDLKGGTTGQVLSKNSNTDMDFTWVAPTTGDITGVTAGTGISGGGTSGAVTITNDMATTITASGDIIVGTGSGTYDNLPIGTTGQVLTADTTVSPYKVKWSSPSGSVITWTERQGAIGGAVNAIAYDGSSLYVAVGGNGKLYTSPDAKTWTSRTSGFGSNDIRGIAYGGGVWVAVGANGTITSSSDGVTWTSRTSNVSTNALNAVHYANSLFVAVGNGANGGTGGITTSSDGTTWTKRTTPTTSSTTLYGVIYGNSEWVAVGGLNTRAGYYSSDAVTWTVLPASAAATFYSVFYQNSVFVATTSASAYTASSASGTWSSRTGFSVANSNTSSSGTQYAIGIYDSKFYTTPNDSNVIVQQPVALNSAGQFQLSVRQDFLPNSWTSVINSEAFAVFVNDAGIILGMDTGQIATSF